MTDWLGDCAKSISMFISFLADASLTQISQPRKSPPCRQFPSSSYLHLILTSMYFRYPQLLLALQVLISYFILLCCLFLFVITVVQLQYNIYCYSNQRKFNCISHVSWLFQGVVEVSVGILGIHMGAVGLPEEAQGACRDAQRCLKELSGSLREWQQLNLSIKAPQGSLVSLCPWCPQGSLGILRSAQVQEVFPDAVTRTFALVQAEFIFNVCYTDELVYKAVFFTMRLFLQFAVLNFTQIFYLEESTWTRCY